MNLFRELRFQQSFISMLPLEILQEVRLPPPPFSFSCLFLSALLLVLTSAPLARRVRCELCGGMVARRIRSALATRVLLEGAYRQGLGSLPAGTGSPALELRGRCVICLLS